MKFLTFVCNECKSSHQAISHRCKSLTMSAWTVEEVAQLERVGGNDVARATWLATAPPPGQQGRPSADGTSSMDTYKAFIVNVYERKLYYRESSNNNNDNASHAATTRTATAPLSTTPAAAAAAPSPTPTTRATMTTPAPLPQQPTVVVADLLDFGAAPAVPAASPNAASGMDLFGDFEPAATTTTAASSSAPTAAVVFDPFGTASATSTTSQASSTFSALPTIASTPTPASFDPLGGHLGGEKSSQTKPPVIMNNMSNSSSAGIGNWMAPMNSAGAMNGMPYGGMGMNSTMNANSGTNPMMMNSFGPMPPGMQQQEQPMMAMMPNRFTMPMQMQQQPQQQHFMMGGTTAFNNHPMSSGIMMNNGFSQSAPVMNHHVNPQLSSGVWSNNTSFNSSMGVQSNNISSNNRSQPSKSSSTHDPFANLGL
jgi:Putative GTPase activating protein for Arf